jgi:hypothetical protein
MAEIRNRITLDASRFERGAAAVNRSARRMQTDLGRNMRRSAAHGAKALAAFSAATVVGLGTGLAVGIKKIITLGSELDHLSRQTGANVADLLVLRQTFTDNGVSADAVRSSIARLQRGLVEASEGTGDARKALDTLGISLDQVRSLSPVDQFKLLGDAINRLDDPAERAAASMRLFGRAGAELQSAFGSGKIDDAASSLGKQAELLQKNAASLERAGTLIDRSSNKLRGFFIGIADKVVPVILPLLERLDKLDLASQGQKFGEGIARGTQILIGLFENNTLGALISESLLLAGQKFINAQVRGWGGLIASLTWGLLNIAGELSATITMGLIDAAVAFGKSLLPWAAAVIKFYKDGFIGIAQTFTGMILEGVGKVLSRIPGFGGKGDAMQAAGQNLQNQGSANRGDAAAALRQGASEVASHFVDAGQSIADRASASADTIANAFMDGFTILDGVDVINLDESQGRIKDLISDALKAGELPPVPIAESPTAGSGDIELDEDGNLTAPGSGAQTGGVSSLASLGGGGGVGGAGVEDAVKTGNTILREIKTGINAIAAQSPTMAPALANAFAAGGSPQPTNAAPPAAAAGAGISGRPAFSATATAQPALGDTSGSAVTGIEAAIQSGNRLLAQINAGIAAMNGKLGSSGDDSSLGEPVLL